MDRIIKVTGKGRLSLKPDTINLTLNLSDSCESYEETLKKSAEQSEVLRECLEKIGFKKNKLKTVSFNVDTKYEGYSDEHGNWKQRFAGYEFRHDFKLEFAADNELLGKVLYALANSSVTPEFNIAYTVKDTEKAKNELLAKAVADSKAKAEVLTAASDVKLGEIIRIDYSWDTIDFAVRPVNRMLKSAATFDTAEAAGYSMDIVPEDINVTDTVTVVWRIY